MWPWICAKNCTLYSHFQLRPNFIFCITAPGFVLMTRWREKRCDCPTLKHDEQDEDKQRKYYLKKKLLDPASVCADAELPASHSIQA